MKLCADMLFNLPASNGRMMYQAWKKKKISFVLHISNVHALIFKKEQGICCYLEERYLLLFRGK